MLTFLLLALLAIILITLIVIMTVWRERCEKCRSWFTSTWYDQRNYPYTDRYTKCLSCGHIHIVVDPNYKTLLKLHKLIEDRKRLIKENEELKFRPPHYPGGSYLDR